ncbi:MraY family glycosyltransferase [uncultured Microbacterium sp.]|uniref:Glycosyl transferase, family 4, conserved region-containing protein n=1 Tax=uncultured Microbacterium sp. TaxID=191216 RepID=A0A1Y5PEG5_9MICO|nr:MraY family glycosyltransferase [uncultured Microbacterium sp.]SBS74531.1 Glycosyl transferase, family 4, conserved region-containing protein [uncultured Microbacterium sp.]
MKHYVFILILTAAITLAFTWIVLRVSLRYKLYPAIRERDVHKTPTPRLGGVAMFLGVVAAFALSSQVSYFAILWQNPARIWAILGATLLIVVIGVADDLWDLDWMIKLGAQFLAAGIIVGFGGIQIFAIPIGGQLLFSSWQSFLLSVFAIVIVMNAVNFIDGLDGLVAGVALIANGVFFVYVYLVARDRGADSYSSLAPFIAVVLVGVCIGFLPLNWNPGKIFMGDSGALMLGLLMATSSIVVTGDLDPGALGDNDVFGRSQLLGAFIPILLPVVIVLLPLLDFGMAVIRRMAKGKSPFSPDRKHLHHRMLDMGHTDRNAVIVFYAWTLVVSLAVLLMYIGTTAGWPGLYWPGVAYLVVGIAACLVVTLPPSRAPRSLPARQELTS